MGRASTIAAIASPPGAARRAVIRLSGPQAREIVLACCKANGAALALEQRGIFRAQLHDGDGQQPVIVFWMPGPASYTGEDVAELHLCGSPPLLRLALERSFQLGAQPAQPGEFTRRAFENARLDLARAEGVLALVHARNEEQRRSASALLLGGLSTRIEALRERLVDLRALCEASLDFDENDTGTIPLEELAQQARALLGALDEALAWEVAREAPSGLPRVALVGAPNSGKSSLFNALCGASALVSELEGTTRDGLRGNWRMEGGQVELWDTAGASLAADEPQALEPDRLAQQRSRELRATADLWLWVVDSSQGPREWSREWRELSAGLGAPPTLLVLNKQDLVGAAQAQALEASLPKELTGRLAARVRSSARSAEGLEALGRETGRALASDAATGEIRALSARHHLALSQARLGVLAALELFRMGSTLDLAAQELRGATDELDQLDGRTTPEDVLDRIFARFCLGK